MNSVGFYSSGGGVSALLRRQGALEDPGESLVTVSTGFTEAPGCAVFTDDVDPPHTVDNANNKPLTRGEAAVLLGKALGLHFAP